MPSSSLSYGERKRGDADVRYQIATPFNPRGNDAEILLIDQGETAEVIIHRIPDPKGYFINYPNPASDEQLPDPTEAQIRENAVANWIVQEACEILSAYEPETSSHTANSGNAHLNDVYFKCEKDNVNKAVLLAKEFLHTLEKKRFMYLREHRETVGRSPKSDLD